ncbi:MAG TPA: NAD+ synthase [Candidatus Lokiarchaeia archaeon]|nr:NAD+ synthase [Candidatus Lokiarchaeia archaeon]
MSQADRFLQNPLQFFDLNWEDVAQWIEKFIAAHVPTTAVLGLSGGVDSALVAYLTAKSLGSDHFHAILMPSRSSEPIDEEYALKVVEDLGITYETIDIQPILESFDEVDPHATEFSLDNLKPRIRMSVLYTYANLHDARVMGTSNKSEWMVGYFTKFGDAGSDVEPIIGLYKQQVFGLARYIGVPAEIVERAPTAGLWSGQTDEGEMGITYVKLDQILCGIDLGLDEDDIVAACGVTEDDIHLVQGMIARSMHKRIQPPFFTLPR